MASIISKDHNFQLFELPDAAWSTLGLKAVQVFCDSYLAHWSRNAFYQILVPGIKAVQFFSFSLIISFKPAAKFCLLSCLLTAKRYKEQDWEIFIQIGRFSFRLCWSPTSGVASLEAAQTINMWNHGFHIPAKGWDDKLVIFSSENFCLLVAFTYNFVFHCSVLQVVIRGYLWLPNANCHRCRKVNKSNWIILCRVIGSHTGGVTDWRGRSTYSLWTDKNSKLGLLFKVFT